MSRDCDLGLACAEKKCVAKTTLRMETTSNNKIVVSSANVDASGCVSVPNSFRLVASETTDAASACIFRVEVSSTNRAAVRVLSEIPNHLSGGIFQGNLDEVNQGLASLSLCPLCGHAVHTLNARAAVVSGSCEVGTTKRRGASANIQVDVRSDFEQIFHGSMALHQHDQVIVASSLVEAEGNSATLNLLAFGDDCSMAATTIGHDGIPHSLPTHFRVAIPHSQQGLSCATLELAGDSKKSLFVHVPRIAGATNVGTLHVESLPQGEDAHILSGIITAPPSTEIKLTEDTLVLEIYDAVVHDIVCLEGSTVTAPIKTVNVDVSTGEYLVEGLERGMYTLIIRNIEGYHAATHIIHLTGSDSSTTHNVHLVPIGEGLHIQTEWSHPDTDGGYGEEELTDMHLYVGFKATVKTEEASGTSNDIFCRVFGSRTSCGDTHFLNSDGSQELIHIEKVHQSIYTIFARNYAGFIPTETSNLHVTVYDKTKKLSTHNLPALSDRTKYLEYILHGDQKFQEGIVNTENPEEFQPEARFVRLACIALDGSIHSAPEYSYHQTSLLSECPPKKIDYCPGGVRTLNLTSGINSTTSSLSFSDGSDAAHHYLNDMECRFDVTAPKGMSVQVTFPLFDLEEHDDEVSNCNDYVEIQSHRYCGTDFPSNLLLDPPFSITFKSDSSTTNLGFTGRLELVDVKKKMAEQMCSSWSSSKNKDDSDNCGGCVSESSADCSWCASTRTCSVTAASATTTCPGDMWAKGDTAQCRCSQRSGTVILEGQAGVFYDGSSSIERYQSNSNCFWEINVPENKWMKMTFVDFELEDGAAHDSCWGDSLTIGDDVVLCGTRHGEEICRQAGKTTISFKSDQTNEGHGFLAKYKIGTASELGCTQAEAEETPIETLNGCICKGPCNPPNDQHFYNWCIIHDDNLQVDGNTNFIMDSSSCQPEFQEPKFDTDWNMLGWTKIDKCGRSAVTDVAEAPIDLVMGFSGGGGYSGYDNVDGYGDGYGYGYDDFSMDMEDEDMSFLSEQGFF
jgi:hypothetical protein